MSSPARRVIDAVPARVHRMLPSALRADIRHRTGLTGPGDLAYRPVPPLPAPGERTGPPDFAVLGAADAGSHWWLAQVADHPDVTPGHASPDAAHFFAPFCTEAFGPAEIAAFRDWFPRRPGRIIGFWSPDGLAYPWVPPLVARAAPRAQVLVLLRDPVERLLDGLVRTADEGPAHPGSYLSDAVDRGYYADQLERLAESYPADQTLVLQYEQCVADPVGSLARTYEFLGVDPGHRARPVAPPYPAPDRAEHRPDAATLARLREVYATDVARIRDRVPGFDLALWPNFSPRT